MITNNLRFNRNLACLLSAMFITGCSSDACNTDGESQQISIAPASTETQERDSALTEVSSIEAFIDENSFCRDVVSGLSLTQFLSSKMGAKEDLSQSRPEIGYRVFDESWFRYEFLDNRLTSIRHVVPRSNQGAEEWIAPYYAAFGTPSPSDMPRSFVEQNAWRYTLWTLPAQNIAVAFAFMPSTRQEEDVRLFGRYINIRRSEDLLNRIEQQSLEPDRDSMFPSRPRPDHEIERLIQDPEWGEVVARIQTLCEGEFTPEKILEQALAIKDLARKGGFSPAFTLRLLREAETRGAKLGLSPVFAVTNCRSSLAFGAGLVDENSIQPEGGR